MADRLSRMSELFKGRYTAEVDQDFVVFIIGMRVNKWWLFHKWLPVAMAMPKMLIKLGQDKSVGMLGAESFFRLFPVTTTLISYWSSFEHLDRFATDRTLPHAAEWSKYMKSVGTSGDVGIYHETYKVHRSDFESVYGNMPRFGLSRAFGHAPISKSNHEARNRFSKS